jgi:hypothetical protein
MEHEMTARLGLPLLAAGQAEKELTHNEALALVDLVLGAGIKGIGTNAPPPDPAVGETWIVGGAPTGAWVGRADSVAGWTGGGWRFVAPYEGLSVSFVAEKLHARFMGGVWTIGEVRASRVLVDGVPVLGPRGVSIAEPTGGTAVDSEARAVLNAILAMLREHGLIAP